jgi:hypothetical protein
VTHQQQNTPPVTPPVTPEPFLSFLCGFFSEQDNKKMHCLDDISELFDPFLMVLS